MDENIANENPYCKKCGNALPNNADYCPACGETTHKTGITYIKNDRGGMRGGQVVAILIGGFLILVSLPFLFGGSALLGVNGFLDQGNGYIGIDDFNLVTSTQVIVAKELDLEDMVIEDMDGPERWVWKPDVGDFVTFRVTADSNDNEDVFIGIVEADDATEFLRGVEYDYLTDLDVEDHRRDPFITYRRNPGDELTTLPADTDIWVVEVSGPGEQTLTWSPEPGNYWLVIMNEDGSPDVDVESSFAVKVPIIGSIGRGLFLGGVVALAVGVLIVYYGAVKPR